MKRFNQIIIAILILSQNLVFGQNIKVTYSSHADLPEAKFLKYFTKKAIKELQKKKYHILVKNDTCSVFAPISIPDDYKEVDTIVVSENQTNIKNIEIKNNIVDIYYFNYKRNIYIRQLNLYNKTYDIKDSIPQRKWKIWEGTKKIHGYTAKKATTKRDYYDTIITAWFTEEVPVSIGPRNFAGLPGLIVKLKINQTTYDIEKVVFPKELPPIFPPKQKKPYLTVQAYYKIYKANKKKSVIIKHECATCPKGM